MPEPIITFESPSGWYGLSVRDVREVTQLRGVRPVPRAPVLVAGLAELHGRVITLVEFERIVGRGEAPPAAQAFGVVLALPFDHLAILVRSEVGVATPDETSPDETADRGSLLRGRVLVGERLLNLLFLPALVARVEGAIREGFRPGPKSGGQED